MDKQSENCMVCGEALTYLAQSQKGLCYYCGKEEGTLIGCPQGHFVCDLCHSGEALEVLGRMALRVASASPEGILEELLALPRLPMHGPEHHPMAGLALLLSARKAGLKVSDEALGEMMRRAMQIPGGACGALGACGAGIGVGVAVSLLSGATPLKGKERALAHRASSRALWELADEEARCCKRSLRRSVAVGRDFLRRELGLTLPQAENGVRCVSAGRNAECPHQRCSYFLGRGES